MTAKDTIFLHIGMHKTASTSLQFSLKHFTDGTTRCARLTRANHSVDLITAFADDPAGHAYYVKRRPAPGHVARKRAEIRGRLDSELHSAERNLILSGEEMCRFTPGEVARMGAFLRPYCRQIRVIAYVRDWVSYASSVFQQVVRHRKVQNLHAVRPQYRLKFEPYLEVFGADAVTLVPFAPDRFRGGSILTDFCDRVGIDPAGIAQQTRNKSLSTEAVALILAWNAGGMPSTGSAAHVRAMGPLVTLLRREFPGRFRFAPELVQARLDPEDLAWVEAQMGQPLPTPPARAEDIGSREALMARGQGALPRLRDILTAQGLTPAAPTAVAMMDALYAKMLAAEQEKPGNRV